MKRKFPDEFYNPISVAGSVIAAICAGLIAFLIILEFFTKEPKPYMGIIAFIILPSIMISGLVLIGYGAYRDYIRKKTGIVRGKHLPVIDFNDPVKRRTIIVFTAGTIGLLVGSAFGSFKAYEYTDSDEFCGTICHSVMTPEYTAYKDSPHSRVGCVKCHIGSGADWFVRAKISGSYQMYSVMFNKYSRPIPTPIENLRPAQQTCEQCHWPKHFYTEKKLERNYYLPDENNSRESMTMLVKIGQSKNDGGVASGIHWHVNEANAVFYGFSDKRRQSIPYIKWVKKDGTEEVFYATDVDKSVIEKSKEELRRMDCIDCHNRPSHIYREPDMEVNHAISTGAIDASLPYIKTVAVDALEKDYRDKAEAANEITNTIRTFYAGNYPGISKQKSVVIDSAIAAVQRLYSRNYFPEMKANWKNYPNNIGHLYYDGCFRCHDGKHKSASGNVIGNKCESCHTIIAQETARIGKQSNVSGMPFTHPGELSNSVLSQKCTDCHGVKKVVAVKE